MKTRIFTLIVILCLANAYTVYAQDTTAGEPVKKESFFKRLFSGKDKTKGIAAPEQRIRTATLVVTNDPFVSFHDFNSHFDRIIPDSVKYVKLAMVSPSQGWFTEGNVMSLVSLSNEIYSHHHYRYGDLDKINLAALEKGVTVIPVFDISVPNARFKEVTGHEMLSVEGMRFVIALLEEFLDNTSFGEIDVVVPDGSFKAQIEELAGYYRSAENKEIKIETGTQTSPE